MPFGTASSGKPAHSTASIRRDLDLAEVTAACYCASAALWRRIPALFIDMTSFLEIFREANSIRAGICGGGARAYSPSPGRTVQSIYR